MADEEEKCVGCDKPRSECTPAECEKCDCPEKKEDAEEAK